MQRNPNSLSNLRPAWNSQTAPVTPGRNAGTRERITKAFLKQLHADWEKYGTQAIVDWREKHLDKYMAGILSLLPKEATLNVNTNSVLDELSADQLAALLAAARQIAGAGDTGGSGPIIEACAAELSDVH